MLFVVDSVKEKIVEIKLKDGLMEGYFVWVSVISGGCFGLIYNMEFDDEFKLDD